MENSSQSNSEPATKTHLLDHGLDILKTGNNPNSATVSELVQTLEEGATKIVNSVEDKAMKALSQVDRLEELPAMVDRSLRSSPYMALGIGFGFGVAVRLLQQAIPAGSVGRAAKSSGVFLAKNASAWAMQAIAQKRI